MKCLEEAVNGAFQKGKHDKIVKNLVQRLDDTGLYDTIKHNVKFYNNSRKKHGEFDVMARAGDRYFVFEVKSSKKHVCKAHQQLRKDRNYIMDVYDNKARVYMFFVHCSKNDSLLIQRYNQKIKRFI